MATFQLHLTVLDEHAPAVANAFRREALLDELSTTVAIFLGHRDKYDGFGFDLTYDPTGDPSSSVWRGER